MQAFEGFCKHRQEEIRIYVGKNEDSAVRIAASNLAKDFESVLGSRIARSVKADDADIVIATVAGKADGAGDPAGSENRLYDEDGNLFSEAYSIGVSRGCLFISGSDRRGTVYGTYEVSRMIGVSPWHYWADMPRRKRKVVEFEEGYFVSDRPLIPYRGIFVNDEEELEAWVGSHGEERTIGPVTYARIYELILRLKGNIMWPAMHVNAFNHNPENARLADEMGVIIGTSHCDIMMRNNYCEWDGWVDEKGYEGIEYDYSIGGINREHIKEYWSESVQTNKDYEVCYTVGMRGIHDSGFETREIDKLGLSEEEALERKKELLERIITDQQKILAEQGVDKDAMQIFVPYKEVLTLYDAGLSVPDNVTLMWVDDNFGYIRRYPNEEERCRKGGNGLYYHGSYWGHPNMSYLFLNSIPLAHTEHELRKSYEQGIRKIWIYNLGAIKPLEQDVDFFFHTAWNMGKDDYNSDTRAYLKEFYDKNFTGGYGEETAGIVTEWAQITNMCKLEHLHRDAFAQEGAIDEAAYRVYRLEELVNRANAIYEKLPGDEKDAFFQFVVFKIHASYILNLIFYYADRSRMCIRQGKFSAADDYTVRVRNLSKRMNGLIGYYNKVLVSGKWDRLVAPFDYPPPSIPTVYDCMPATLRGGKPDRRWCNEQITNDVMKADPDENCYLRREHKTDGRIGVMLCGADETGRSIGTEECITFWKDGFLVKCLEIFPVEYGMKEIFRVEHSKGVCVSKTNGNVDTEVRIGVWISDASVSGEREYVRIYDADNLLVREYSVRIVDYGHSAGASVSEADGTVIIEAEDFGCSGWRLVSDVGRGYGDVLEYAGYSEGNSTEHGSGSTGAQYNQYPECIFEIADAGEYIIEVQRFPSLDSTGQIYLLMYLDNMPVRFSTTATDEWRGNWKNNVINGMERLTAKVILDKPGGHIIKLVDASMYFAFSRIVIHYGASTELGGWIRKSRVADGYWDIPKMNAVFYDDSFEICEDRDWTAVWFLEYSEKKIDLVHSHAVMRKMPQMTAMPEQIEWNRLNECMPVTDAPEPYCYKDGAVRIRAIDALCDNDHAWVSPGISAFEYALSGSYDDERFYVCLSDNKDDDACGELNYRIYLPEQGEYTISVYANVFDGTSEPVTVSVDGCVIPLERMSGNGSIWTFDGLRIFQIIELTRVGLDAGEHVLTFGIKKCIRIKDLFLYRDAALIDKDA